MITLVLGNHDIHLLAANAGAIKPKPDDTINEILRAEDGDELCNWLRTMPLAHYENDYLMVHAGVLPMWDADRVMRLAAEASAAINGEQWYAFAKVLYGDMPDNWLATLQLLQKSFPDATSRHSRALVPTPAGANRFVPLGVCRRLSTTSARYPRKCQKRQSNRYQKITTPRRTSGAKRIPETTVRSRSGGEQTRFYPFAAAADIFGMHNRPYFVFANAGFGNFAHCIQCFVARMEGATHRENLIGAFY